MSVRRQRPRHVNKVHHLYAKKFPQRIRLCWQHNFRHLRPLLERNADYIPAYLMYGQLLARESRASEARQVLSTGIAAAARKGDEHARSEMEALLNDLN